MSLYGIDISSYQKGLNIGKVKADFVIIKATGGLNYVNPYCNYHYAQAKKHKRKIGLYHFAHENKSNHTAVHEANYFIKNIKNYVGSAILVLDYEEPLNHKSYTSKDVSWIYAFCKQVKKLTNVTPVLYMSKSVVQRLNFDSVVKSNVGLWFAQYANYNPMGYVKSPWTDNKGTGSWKSAMMFQYTSSGRLKGYSGNLDLDIFYGSKTAWDKYAKGK